MATQRALSAFLPTYLLLTTQCVSSYEVVGEVLAEEEPWSQATCHAAISSGTSGDPCTGTFECESELLECCRWSASCVAGALSLTHDCELCGCTLDSQCKLGTVCSGGFCRDCVETPVCKEPFRYAERNGCAYCVPRTVCQDDRDCPAGSHCYAGQTCPPGCVEDPSCCRGNGCADPGCGTTAGLDCAVIGCPEGFYCDLQVLGQVCRCEQGRWVCTPEGMPNVCRPL